MKGDRLKAPIPEGTWFLLGMDGLPRDACYGCPGWGYVRREGEYAVKVRKCDVRFAGGRREYCWSVKVFRCDFELVANWHYPADLTEVGIFGLAWDRFCDFKWKP